MLVSDLIAKKNVEVKLEQDSQVRKIPQPLAQRIAQRLKSASADSAAASGPAAPASGGGANSATLARGDASGTNHNGSGNGSGGDLQQMLAHLPASTLADFQKGDAVMIVATSQDSQTTAITLLGGVEAILQASPQGEAASILTPWSLNSGGAGDSGTP